MYQRNPIGDMLERINMADGIANPTRRIDFLMGNKYQTGSDYDDEILHMKLGDLMGLKKCGACDGRGWNIYNTSPDGDKDICNECDGSQYEGKPDDRTYQEYLFKRAI